MVILGNMAQVYFPDSYAKTAYSNGVKSLPQYLKTLAQADFKKKGWTK